jgi:hypothetical protein
MKVSTKNFDVDMNLKSNGIELEIYDNQDERLGDVILTKTSVIWCRDVSVERMASVFPGKNSSSIWNETKGSRWHTQAPSTSWRL